MGPGVKEDETETGGRKTVQLITFFFLLNISSLLAPTSGFALKTCRISYNIAKCAGLKLTAVARDIPSAVKGFDLSSNKISRVHVSDFENLPVLTQLDLNRNFITLIDDGAFANLISLNKLNLNNNKLGKLGAELFRGLSNLTELRVRSNSIKAVAETTFQPMKSLKLLDFSHNKLGHITKVKSMLQHLPNLRELYLKSNGFTTFHSEELTNSSLVLKYLDLSQNPITDFQITANVFPNLTWFNIGGAPGKTQMIWDVRNKTFLSRVSTLDITGLRMKFGDMKTLLWMVNSSLTSLRLNAMRTNLTALVQTSCTVPTLSVLQLRLNKLFFVSSDLFKLCFNVTEIDLTDNKIKTIRDDAFRSLHSLKILSLSHNKLSSVPRATRNLPSLAELDLSSNNITKLGCDDFANQTKLKQLNLYQNSIAALAECVFKDLVRLQVLKLQSNRLSNLNGAFKIPLPYLKQLLLNTNTLTAIKRGEFSGLRSLQNLSLHQNKISELEYGSFGGLTSLTDLLLQSNQIKETEINKGVFNDLINLRRLELRDNHIKYYYSSSLPLAPFSRLSRLETLAIPSQHGKGGSQLPRNLLQGLTNLLDFSIRDMHLVSLHKDMFNDTPQLTNLDISSNELKDLSPDWFSQIPNLKSLYISRTSLTSLDYLTDANLTKLEFVQARKNEYSVISEDIINSLPSLVYADFQGNGFTCDCDNAWFIQWIQNNNQTQVFDAYNFKCNYPVNLKGMKLLELDIRLCSVNTEFIMFISTTCAILVFMLASFIYHFLRWHLAYAYYFFLALLFDTKHKNRQPANQYDAFVSYNTNDEPWIMRELLPKLEGEQGWRLCLHHRDFMPGKPIVENIVDAIYGSRKTICVISRRYLESEWCSREMQVASFRLFDEQKDVLILVFLEDIPTAELSPYYRMKKLLNKMTYLSWPRAAEHTELFWEKLRQALWTGEDRVDECFPLNVVDNQR
ncbi:toll-like receptor 22 [Hippoglossus hippoglossus]|uniref:toll-like receptor 22 n=1 Tax=Hippoglossus hippoglossus TaxID=8267 RepID=UPI00148D2E05|nr:toll-like receptor 22 [Hippoglossus hippoglossus]